METILECGYYVIIVIGPQNIVQLHFSCSLPVSSVVTLQAVLTMVTLQSVGGVAAAVRVRQLEVAGRAVAEVAAREAGAGGEQVEAVQSLASPGNLATSLLPAWPNLAILVSLLGLLLVFVLTISLGVARLLSRNKGETYYTQETLVQAQT